LQLPENLTSPPPLWSDFRGPTSMRLRWWLGPLASRSCPLITWTRPPDWRANFPTSWLWQEKHILMSSLKFHCRIFLLRVKKTLKTVFHCIDILQTNLRLYGISHSPCNSRMPFFRTWDSDDVFLLLKNTSVRLIVNSVKYYDNTTAYISCFLIFISSIIII